MDEKKLLGKRIQELRRARNLSQEDLAEKLDLNAKYLGFVEQGRANPTLTVLIGIAKALKVDLVDLFNHPWLKLTEVELRKKIKVMGDKADVQGLREMFALMKTRDL